MPSMKDTTGSVLPAVSSFHDQQASLGNYFERTQRSQAFDMLRAAEISE